MRSCVPQWAETPFTAGGALAGDGFDGGLLLADVLDVDRGDDGDPLIEDRFDVLPAVRIRAASGIVEGELVDQADGGPAAEHGGQIDGAIDCGDRFQACEDRMYSVAAFFLHGGDDDILAAFLAAAPFIEHPE